MGMGGFYQQMGMGDFYQQMGMGDFYQQSLMGPVWEKLNPEDWNNMCGVETSH